MCQLVRRVSIASLRIWVKLAHVIVETLLVGVGFSRTGGANWTSKFLCTYDWCFCLSRLNAHEAPTVTDHTIHAFDYMAWKDVALLVMRSASFEPAAITLRWESIWKCDLTKFSNTMLGETLNLIMCFFPLSCCHFLTVLPTMNTSRS